jgi:esterase/lipase
MKNFAIVLTTFFFLGWICTPIQALQQPRYDELEAMLKKVEANLQTAGQATKLAQSMSAEMVESKVAEKAQLKQAVAAAESQVQAMQQVNEIFAAKMIANGMDTSLTPMKYAGPIYDAWLNYVEEGGTEEFDYFRMYLWQQK